MGRGSKKGEREKENEWQSENKGTLLEKLPSRLLLLLLPWRHKMLKSVLQAVIFGQGYS